MDFASVHKFEDGRFALCEIIVGNLADVLLNSDLTRDQIIRNEIWLSIIKTVHEAHGNETEVDVVGNPSYSRTKIYELSRCKTNRTQM